MSCEGSDRVDNEDLRFVSGNKEIVKFNPELPAESQDPVLAGMMRRGPQRGDLVWTGCTGAYVSGLTPEKLIVMRGRPGEAPLDPLNYVPAFYAGGYGWIPKNW